MQVTLRDRPTLGYGHFAKEQVIYQLLVRNRWLNPLGLARVNYLFHAVIEALLFLESTNIPPSAPTESVQMNIYSESIRPFDE
jgi:hypothetical protein